MLDRQLEQDAETSNFEYSVLARLSMADDLMMQLSDLAAQCNSSQPRLSKVMVRFEQRQWVTRQPDPANGRYTLATLTEAGLQKVADCAPGHVERVREEVKVERSEPRGSCGPERGTMLTSTDYGRVGIIRPPNRRKLMSQ